MKRRQSQQSIETHDISQRKYPMPGTDLGSTNAIPFNEAVDVDASGGRQCNWDLGKGDDCSHFSYLDRSRAKDVIPDGNPTRAKRQVPEWMPESSLPTKAKR